MLTKKREYLNTDAWHQLFLITDYGQEGRDENGGAEDNTTLQWGDDLRVDDYRRK